MPTGISSAAGQPQPFEEASAGVGWCVAAHPGGRPDDVALGAVAGDLDVDGAGVGRDVEADRLAGHDATGASSTPRSCRSLG